MIQPTTSHPIVTISPTRLEDLLACPLRFSWTQQGHGGVPPPPSEAALKGLAAHRTLELLISGDLDDVDAAWDSACEELTAAGADPRPIFGVSRVRARLAMRYPELTAFIDEFDPHEVLTELPLGDEDSPVRGIADLVLVGVTVGVVDYKSGLATDQSDVKAAFRRQTLIYAKLASEAHGRAIGAAAVFSLRQGLILLEADAKAVQASWDQAIAALEAFNEIAPGQQPARPSIDACRWCHYNLSCKPGLEELLARGPEAGMGAALIGPLTRDPVVAANGRSAIFVQYANVGERVEVRVTEIPTGVVKGLGAGSPIVAINLRRRSDDPLLYVWADGASQLAVGDPWSHDTEVNQGIQ